MAPRNSKRTRPIPFDRLKERHIYMANVAVRNRRTGKVNRIKPNFLHPILITKLEDGKAICNMMATFGGRGPVKFWDGRKYAHEYISLNNAPKVDPSLLKIPTDPDIVKGHLWYGQEYYVRPNPSDRVYLGPQYNNAKPYTPTVVPPWAPSYIEELRIAKFRAGGDDFNLSTLQQFVNEISQDFREEYDLDDNIPHIRSHHSTGMESAHMIPHCLIEESDYEVGRSYTIASRPSTPQAPSKISSGSLAIKLQGELPAREMPQELVSHDSEEDAREYSVIELIQQIKKGEELSPVITVMDVDVGSELDTGS